MLSTANKAFISGKKMVDVKEPEIKLFGMKIMLPENWKNVAVLYGGESSDEIDDENSCRSDNGVCLDDNKANRTEHEQDADEGKQQIEEEGSAPERCESNLQEKDQRTDEGESRNSHPLSEFDDPKTPTIDEDVASIHPLKSVNDQRNGTNSQQNTLKKPDKILPCPRCKSMDTKFCYYNNYNISQPRHFCRSCQRYWTAGGNMRNMQVGAGRRKTKNSASDYCHHIAISEAFQASQLDSPNGFHHLTFRPNGTVLSFGPDSQNRESMASVLKLADTVVPTGIGKGYCKSDQGTSISCKIVENGDDSSCNGSSVTTSKSTTEGGDSGSLEPVMQNINSFPYPVPCIPGVPWPVAWGSAVPVSPVCPTGLPMPFYPAHYWNVPWLPFQLPAPNRKALGSSPDSPLGKHSRDGELLKSDKTESKECLEEKNSKSSIVVPKTLRFDNPDEAAKSPIWATLGMKGDSMRREGLFKAFQPKSDEKKPVAMASTIMHANPAALSRSLVFQESA